MEKIIIYNTRVTTNFFNMIIDETMPVAFIKRENFRGKKGDILCFLETTEDNLVTGRFVFAEVVSFITDDISLQPGCLAVCFRLREDLGYNVQARSVLLS